MSSKSRRRLPGSGECTQNTNEDILRALPAEFSDVLRAPQKEWRLSDRKTRANSVERPSIQVSKGRPGERFRR